MTESQIFAWPVSVPSGHRSYSTESGNIRKNVNQITVSYEDGKVIDLFHDKEIDEKERLTLITAAMGTFGGIRNELSSGYVNAACINAPAVLKPDDPSNADAPSIKTGPYAKARIEVRYEKLVRTCSIEYLMNACFIMGWIVDESESVPIALVDVPVEPKEPVVKVTNEELKKLFAK
jgi:hypothetical protein